MPLCLYLPEPFVEALRAMKDYASASSRTLVGSDAIDKDDALQDAKRRKELHAGEVREISRILMRSTDPGLTIHTITEQLLARELGKEHQPA